MDKVERSATLFFSFFIIVFIVLAILSWYVNKKMFPIEINSIIHKIEVSPARRCDFYDSKGEKIKIYGYGFFASEGIKIGDKIIKKANSNELLVYRQDGKGKYKLIKVKSNQIK